MYCMRNISKHTLHDLDLEITHIFPMLKYVLYH